MMKNIFTFPVSFPFRRHSMRSHLQTPDERGKRSLTDRQFEVGPHPARWPQFMTFDATPQGDPDRVIGSMVRQNWRILLAATIAFLFMFVGSALIPWALGIFLDSGLEQGLQASLIPGCLLMCFIVGVRALGSLGEPLGVVVWMRGAFAWCRDVVTHVSGMRNGGRNAIPSGEIVSAATSDSPKLGNLMYSIPSTIASLTSFAVIVVLMLKTHVMLGLVVAIGLPISVALMTLLIKPLHKRLAENREERGKLTTLASDAVVGLRVLRGVGGEGSYNERYEEQSRHVMDTGIKAALVQAVLGGLTTAVPALFSAIVISLGLWSVYAGELSYGNLVAFYGYTAYLAVPVSSATNFFQMLTDARVGARRIERILESQPLISSDREDPSVPIPDWSRARLIDDERGVVIESGCMSVIVSARPDISAGVAQRFARVDDSPIRVAWDSNDIDIRTLPVSNVRDNIVLSGAIAQLFQGRLRSNVNGRHADEPLPRPIGTQMADTGDGAGVATRDHLPQPGAASDGDLMRVLAIADATDIIHGFDEGLDGYVAERGRSLSGGQRQRLSLARAVATNAPILIGIEPTSAVDSHTELRISKALYNERRGKTTVIVSVSPIILHQADRVIFLDKTGHVIATGTHAELSERADYHAIVHRASEPEHESETESEEAQA